ncbi:MAG: hypothetical protein QOH87_1386, partial [Trebonia sp.]|nr:hypothetical protein [Trebonia sp.]
MTAPAPLDDDRPAAARPTTAESPTPVSLRWAYWGFVAVAATTLATAAARSPAQLKYDENYHFPTAREFAERQSLRDFLATPRESAPGPLYSAFHAALAPATGFAIVPHRLANVGLLFATVAVLGWMLWRIGGAGSLPVAGMYFAVPVVWPIGVMALTETPAILAATLSLAAVVGVLGRSGAGRQFAGYGLSGLAAGGAILGRQPYLPLVVMPVVLGGWGREWLGRTTVFLAAALPLPLAVFAIWGGLLPAGTRHAGGGIAPLHGLLAFAYVALFVAFIAPRWYAGSWRPGVAAAIAAAAVALALGFEYRALDQVSQRFPGWLQPYYPRVVGAGLAGLAAWFLVSCGCNCATRRGDRLFVGCVILVVLLTAT